MADTIELSHDVRDHLASHPLCDSRMEILTSACDSYRHDTQSNFVHDRGAELFRNQWRC
jgi:hypothetical protein